MLENTNLNPASEMDKEASQAKAEHMIEKANADAEATAIKAEIAEAESAFVPEAGRIEVVWKSEVAKEAADNAYLIEESVYPATQTLNK